MSSPTSVPVARLLMVAALVLVAFAAGACRAHAPKPGTVLDEARRAGLTVDHFKAAGENYFRDMDGGISLDAEAIKGRNMWIVWTGGNDKFWDRISVDSPIRRCTMGAGTAGCTWAW